MLFLLFLIAVTAPQARGSAEPGCTAPGDSTPIQPVGAFSDLRFTEEHAYGYTVELWRAGNCLFGLLEASEGLSGDTPTGILSQVRHDRATGKLSFEARLTMGVTQPKNATAWVPSRELFQFSGHLGPRLLQGKLIKSDRLRPELRPVEQDLVLRLSQQQQEFMIQAPTYGEWRLQADQILRARGPKW